MSKPILSVRNLEVVLEGEKILDDINFDLAPKDNLAIIGPNGSGKTVLLKSILGLIPHKGAIEKAPGVKIGYVPQKIDADRHLPITFRNLFAAKGKTTHTDLEQHEIVLRQVGLPDETLDIPVGHLSGGQFQRCLIAFALFGQPELMILDEPTASIDAPGEEQIYALIHRLQEETGITIITVSHEINLVYRFATKVLCLNHTRICMGSPQEVLTAETLNKLFGEEMKHYDHLQK